MNEVDGRTFTYEVERIDAVPCEAGSFREWTASRNRPCKKTAHARVQGIALCTFHAGFFVTHGSAPTGEGNTFYQDPRRGPVWEEGKAD